MFTGSVPAQRLSQLGRVQLVLSTLASRRLKTNVCLKQYTQPLWLARHIYPSLDDMLGISVASIFEPDETHLPFMVQSLPRASSASHSAAYINGDGMQVPSLEDRQELPPKKLQALAAVLERMIEAWDSSEGEAPKSSTRKAGLYNKVLS